MIRRFALSPFVYGLFLALFAVSSADIRPSSAADWPAYLFGPTHSSSNRLATAITPANAAGLVQAWQWTPDPPTIAGQPASSLVASPTVFRGRIYIGTNSGDFYALDETTGNAIWKQFIAFAPATTCGAIGFTSTATVAPDPVTLRPTVYVGAADGYLYALDAANGSTVWRSLVAAPSVTQNDYYIWGSPTVINSRVYIGISSDCDNPLVQGGLKAFDQSTGSPVATYNTVPAGTLGGSIWTSAAATRTGSVWVTTGNNDPNSPQAGDSTSIVRLDGQTLAKQDIWTVPANQQTPDGDFGASPTLFTAKSGRSVTSFIGACNKNGTFYALRSMRLSAGPVWSFQVGASATGSTLCAAAAAWDGSRLFVAGNGTTIGGVAYKGSLRQLNPATGTPIWETGLPAQILGSPTLNGAGVLAAASWDLSAPNAAYLLDAGTGAVLATISTSNSKVFAQQVFADNVLLIATQTQGLRAYKPGP